MKGKCLRGAPMGKFLLIPEWAQHFLSWLLFCPLPSFHFQLDVSLTNFFLPFVPLIASGIYTDESLLRTVNGDNAWRWKQMFNSFSLNPEEDMETLPIVAAAPCSLGSKCRDTATRDQPSMLNQCQKWMKHPRQTWIKKRKNNGIEMKSGWNEGENEDFFLRKIKI